MEHMEGFNYDPGMQQREKGSNCLRIILNRKVNNYVKNVVLILNISTFKIENMHMHHRILLN